MDISVIIPTHNRLDLVGRAIRSVLNQTYPALEVIVVDDASTDGTAEMVADDYPQVKLLRQTRGGVSAARNTGISESVGNCIALLDSDDEWLPDKLMEQVNVLSETPQGAICHTDEIWIRDGVRVNPRKRHRKPSGWIFSHCLPLCCVSPSSILFLRTVIDKIGNFDVSLPVCEDYDLWLRMSIHYPFYLVDSPQVVKYGGHPDQLSRRHWGMDRFRVRSLLSVIESGQLDETQAIEARMMLLHKLSILIKGAKKRGKKNDLKDYRELVRLWS